MMATVFDSHFAAAGFPMLLDNFGESITYWPYGGAAREIIAIVERSPPAIFDAAGNALLPTATVRVYNSATSGVSSKQVDIGKDEIEMAGKIGDTLTKRFGLMTMISQDSGVVQLALI
jgi:hypothetical protein